MKKTVVLACLTLLWLPAFAGPPYSDTVGPAELPPVGRPPPVSDTSGPAELPPKHVRARVVPPASQDLYDSSPPIVKALDIYHSSSVFGGQSHAAQHNGCIYVATSFAVSLSGYDPQGVFRAIIDTGLRLNATHIDAIPKTTRPAEHEINGAPKANPGFGGSRAWVNYEGGTIYDLVELRVAYTFPNHANVARLKAWIENGRYREFDGQPSFASPVMEFYVRRAGPSAGTAAGMPCPAPTEAELPR